MPNRTIKESIITSETLSEVSGDEERLFWRLVVLADDYGRFHGDPVVLRPMCFPRLVDRISQEQFNSWLQRLIDVGILFLYEAEGRKYLQITNWLRHHKPRAAESKYPDPDEPDSRRTHLQARARKRKQASEDAPEVVNEVDNEVERESSPAPDGAPPTSPTAENIAALWNEVCGPVLPSVRGLSEKRRKHLRARMAEGEERRSLGWWRAYFERIRQSAFCRGDNDRGWRATFEWAIGSEDVVLKVLEGKYDGRASPREPTDLEGGSISNESLQRLMAGVTLGPGDEEVPF